MTKEELSQLYYLNREIEQLKRQLDNMEFKTKNNIVTDSVTASSIEFPYVAHSVKITGTDASDYFKKVKRLNEKIKERLNKLLDKTEEINDYIASVPDSEMRIILAMRYVNGLTWEEIAANMNYAKSTVRNKHDKFIKCSTN